MAFSRPLGIAIVALALLFGSVSFEVAFHRTMYVDVKDGTDWRPVATDKTYYGRGVPSVVPYGTIVVPVNGTVDARLRVDNGYPWATTQHYRVIVNGVIAAEGDVSAPARGEGSSEFHLNATKLYAQSGTAPIEPAAPAKMGSANFYVEVGTSQIFVSFQIQEAS